MKSIERMFRCNELMNVQIINRNWWNCQNVSFKMVFLPVNNWAKHPSIRWWLILLNLNCCSTVISMIRCCTTEYRLNRANVVVYSMRYQSNHPDRSLCFQVIIFASSLVVTSLLSFALPLSSGCQFLYQINAFIGKCFVRTYKAALKCRRNDKHFYLFFLTFSCTRTTMDKINVTVWPYSWIFTEYW